MKQNLDHGGPSSDVGTCDPRIAQFPINWAIYLGLAIYNRDYSLSDSGRRASGSLVIEEFHRSIASFPHDSLERVYLTRILMISVDLAHGIRTKKEIREARLDDATRDRDMHYQRLVKAERWQGLLKLALKLLLLSGFGFAIAKTFLSTRPDDPARQVNEGWASTAFGLGFALLATYIRSWMIDRKIGNLFKRHDREAHIAEMAYQRTVRREYQWAADEAIHAWECMTGCRPNTNTAALMSLMSPEIDDDDISP
jgi:hypothetical protein